MEPTPDRFRALARSSPWRFTTLRFVLTPVAAGADAGERVRAWLRRPGRLRVEQLDGHPVCVVRHSPPTVGR